jgi:hypothetical protein
MAAQAAAAVRTVMALAELQLVAKVTMVALAAKVLAAMGAVAVGPVVWVAHLALHVAAMAVTV